MNGQISLNFSNAIDSISIFDGTIEPVRVESVKVEKVNNLALQKEKEELAFASTALKKAIAKVNHFYGNIVSRRSEEIAKLSIEIARKILAQKIESKDYEIESIIEEALKSCSSKYDIIIHLNPEDYELCREIIKKDTNTMLSDITLIADPNVGRAECILKSPKGTIISMINDQLEQIENALKVTQ